jgi:8-oxo-dGTP pyrophosphatase MutT (NUDIX family)
MVREISAGAVVVRKSQVCKSQVRTSEVRSSQVPQNEEQRNNNEEQRNDVPQNDSGWQVAVIEPARAHPNAVDRKGTKSAARAVVALPKGLIDAGETSTQAALREVREETGLTALLIAKLANIRYVYVRSWGDGERVFKIVTFYLFRYQSGDIDEIDPAMRVEVKQAFWLALEEAEAKLSYRGERQVVGMAQDYLRSHPEVFSE